MKKKLLIALSLLAVGHSYAQNTFNTTTATWANGSGSLSSTEFNGAIELGPGSANLATPYIDWHFGTGVSQDYNVRLINSGNNRFDIWTASNGPVLTVNGLNVGIGVINPTMPLDISGNVVLRNTTNATGAGASLLFTSYGDNASPGAKIRNALVFAQGASSVSKLILSSYNSGYYPDELTLYQGNVGIGTYSPDAKLAVAGTIHATEVLVDQTVPTPDYVFDKDYRLTSLKDVKTYIDQNHHLPEIPCAAQVAKDGINLGEMNAKLLKKIEELTLYLIEKEKQIEDIKIQQKEDSQSQQLQIDELKKQIKILSKTK